ncbi:MAG: efflux transporter periplasmic adaptor subunit [Paucimonas sp.]|nr:efflux transporter periplasmic adaptor subunit [Paucimonas sp.]
MPKPKTSGIVLILAVLAAAGGGWWYYANNNSQRAAAEPRVPVQAVKTALAQKRTVAVTLRANGNVTPFNIVEVRPQAQNIVRQVHVREGQDVKAGQLLFTLDQRVDSSNVERARAQVERDRADLAEAEANLKRSQELLARKFLAPAAVDTARARVESLRGALRADVAAAQGSSATLSNNRIVASIAGRIGLITVHAGSLAQPTSAPMLTIAQVEPIAVSFSVPENELQNIRRSYPEGDAPVKVELGDRQVVEGKLYFIDNTADSQTGTIRMKARFENADRKLWPGTYVGVSLVSRRIADAVVLPPQAIVTGPTDRVVYIVQADSTVRMQKVQVLAIDDGEAAVSGVEPGARVVVEGAQNLRPKARVREADAPAGDAGSASANRATRL